MQYAIGVDLGGSHTTAALVAENGDVLVREEQDIVDRSFEAVASAVTGVINAVCKDSRAKKAAGIGIGSPGNIDTATGTVLYSPNFDWHDAPLGERLRSSFSMPVHVANDARCATLGEYTFGSGRGTENFALLTLGTGIGGGIVSGGELLIGNRAGAGELGHQQIRPTDGFICGCGKIGCLEAQASGTGLMRHAVAVAPSFPKSTLIPKPEKFGSKMVRRAAQAGDRHALAAWTRWSDDLAIGLANLIAFVNPELIALGGGVSSAGDFLLDSVRERMDALTVMVPRGTTRLVIAQLGNDAGYIGAATMALRGGLTTGRAR